MLPPRPKARPGLSRRLLLLGGLSAAAGCSLAGPRGDEPPPSLSAPNRTPGPSQPPGAPPPAARREQAVADAYAALLHGRLADDLDQAQRRRVRSLRDAHDWHAAALRSADPTLRPNGPTPTRDPKAAAALRDLSLAQALALLARRERGLAERHQATATKASGLPALLAGSLAVAAGRYARTVAGEGPAVRIADASTVPPVLADVAARQELVRQLHAMVYGYQLALGRLPGSSERQARARRGLAAVRTLRDRLSVELTRRSAAVPVAAAAYVPPVQPSSAATAAELARRMEVALLPFAGLWLAAAAAPADRRVALKTLSATEARAAAWGAPPTVWPGWAD